MYRFVHCSHHYVLYTQHKIIYYGYNTGKHKVICSVCGVRLLYNVPLVADCRRRRLYAIFKFSIYLRRAKF